MRPATGRLSICLRWAFVVLLCAVLSEGRATAGGLSEAQGRTGPARAELHTAGLFAAGVATLPARVAAPCRLLLEAEGGSRSTSSFALSRRRRALSSPSGQGGTAVPFSASYVIGARYRAHHAYLI